MCTTVIITKGATIDGSMVVAHSDDDELSDQRIIFVPAQDYELGALRPIFHEHYLYPRMVTDQRGPAYDTPDYPPTEPIGFIPQVEHTYAYFDGNYGIMNEHNLMMGECTNGANYEPVSVTAAVAKETGKHMRLFYSSELSRIALERCKTAREAINLMGALIDEYGYYSTGETLLVADGDEAWVFEMCALPDEQYHSAWVAKLVPDGELFVAANEFRIRQVEENKPDLIYSSLLFAGLEKIGWWDPKDGSLDWLKAVSPGEYNHPYYSLRRVWRVLDRVNPDLGLSPWVEDGYTEYYPFSVAPKHKLHVQDIFSLYRDHYEGTQFDMTKGVAAGAYGDPHRFAGPYDGNQNDVTKNGKLYGAWERPISVFYQGYTYVTQLRPNAPEATKGIVWFGPDVSYTTCFTPFPAKVSQLPWAYQSGSTQKLDRKSAWWAFDFVGNWSRLNFQRMTQVDILPLQRELEQMQFQRLYELDNAVREVPYAEAIEMVTEFSQETTQKVLEQWWELADLLVAKYADGYINRPDVNPKEVGYPATWLASSDYKNGPTTYDMRS